MNSSAAPARLKQWREKQGWNQQQAAEHFGVGGSTYWKWEHGHAEPRLKWLLSIAKLTKGFVKLAHWTAPAVSAADDAEGKAA